MLTEIVIDLWQKYIIYKGSSIQTGNTGPDNMVFCLN